MPTAVFFADSSSARVAVWSHTPPTQRERKGEPDEPARARRGLRALADVGSVRRHEEVRHPERCHAGYL